MVGENEKESMDDDPCSKEPVDVVKCEKAVLEGRKKLEDLCGGPCEEA